MGTAFPRSQARLGEPQSHHPAACRVALGEEPPAPSLRVPLCCGVWGMAGPQHRPQTLLEGCAASGRDPAPVPRHLFYQHRLPLAHHQQPRFQRKAGVSRIGRVTAQSSIQVTENSSRGPTALSELAKCWWETPDDRTAGQLRGLRPLQPSGRSEHPRQQRRQAVTGVTKEPLSLGGAVPTPQSQGYKEVPADLSKGWVWPLWAWVQGPACPLRAVKLLPPRPCPSVGENSPASHRRALSRAAQALPSQHPPVPPPGQALEPSSCQKHTPESPQILELPPDSVSCVSNTNPHAAGPGKYVLGEFTSSRKPSLTSYHPALLWAAQPRDLSPPSPQHWSLAHVVCSGAPGTWTLSVISTAVVPAPTSKAPDVW